MPNPRWLARANRVWINPVARRVSTWMPGLGVIVHRGRVSGSLYRTPVNVFPRGDSFVIALTYGQDADWVKNVLAAQGCVLLTRRREIALGTPRIYRDETRGDMPAVVRAILRVINVEHFLRLTPPER
ncbi:nitroreductase family deazaflavin-dependent oxidoreductase [Phytoactinopolyspora alkaliphila]|uniref:Nitroreductase family deazaflavin-dependent oxidoreductase n=1 Tax=Phytoactinopolyspora alkaliphila TaxID=1783498 RepID=A0A6N9YL91_9ACTN|nr:nitroreductase family deazaflavin-dependent oxidoreductase [Phytoactinopolyspora alkaliphila]NED95690.1 nitroreductase family deazaflavin-dependent oxidoreductase [Phytoactinopolyspora alkaliphila]